MKLGMLHHVDSFFFFFSKSQTLLSSVYMKWEFECFALAGERHM